MPSTSTRIKSCAVAAADLQHLSKKVFRMESKNKALRALGKTGKTSLQIDNFRSKSYKPNSCISSYLEHKKKMTFLYTVGVSIHINYMEEGHP